MAVGFLFHVVAIVIIVIGRIAALGLGLGLGIGFMSLGVSWRRGHVVGWWRRAAGEFPLGSPAGGFNIVVSSF